MAKYDSFAEFVRGKIRSGAWPPNHRLPSQAQWATGEAGFKVLYGSMRGGYLVLRAEGWIVGQQGEGVFVTSDPPDWPGKGSRPKSNALVTDAATIKQEAAKVELPRRERVTKTKGR